MFYIFRPLKTDGFCLLVLLIILLGLFWYGVSFLEHELTLYKVAREQAAYYEQQFPARDKP